MTKKKNLLVMQTDGLSRNYKHHLKEDQPAFSTGKLKE